MRWFSWYRRSRAGDRVEVEAEGGGVADDEKDLRRRAAAAAAEEEEGLRRMEARRSSVEIMVFACDSIDRGVKWRCEVSYAPGISVMWCGVGVGAVAGCLGSNNNVRSSLSPTGKRG